MHIKQVSEPIRVWFQQGFSFAGADTEMRAQSSVVLTGHMILSVTVVCGSVRRLAARVESSSDGDE